MNMPRYRKIIAGFLILVMALGLTACGSFGLRMAKAAIKMQNLQSFRTDLDMNLGMSVSMFGESLDLDLTMTGTADISTDPLKARLDMDVTGMDESENVLSYLEKTGDNLIIYSSVDDGRTWSKAETDASQFPESGMDKESLAWLTKLADSFEQTGTETVKGSEAMVYSGTFTWSALEEYVNLDAALDMMGKTMSETMGADIDLSDLDLSSVGDVPLTICIDRKSGMIVKYSMDMTAMMQTLMPAVMQAAMEAVMSSSELGALIDPGSLDLNMLGFEFNLNKLVVTAILYDFDNVNEIEIPEEALKAENITA